MKSTTLRVWNPSPQNTDEFELVTKLTDLGTPVGGKHLIGFYVNMVLKDRWTVDSTYGFVLRIEYRQSEQTLWNSIALMSNVMSSPTTSSTTPSYFIKYLNHPIKGLRHIQLRLKGVYMRGDLGINDFGLIYRTTREITASTLEEE